LMLAWACGLRTMRPRIAPGMRISAPYWARPVTLSMPSGRTGRVPMTLYLGFAGAVTSGSYGLAAGGGGGAHVFSGQHHGADDLVIAGAAAEVAGELVADARFVGVGFLFEQRLRGDDEPGCADAALERG